MNARTDTPVPINPGRTRIYNGTAPSLRVPVTAENRELLRRLREAELTAWRDADAKRPSFRIQLSRFSCQPLFRLNVNRV